ncbi:MAG: hypothetical protein F9K32_04495 [Desulfobulbaceae bacterium]|nr:MAG: hypothetical protein F9K32_04495 [Desulfobulbaceae bacterium]
MEEDERLINEAHDLFGDYSIFEVIDLDRPAAIERMKEMYGNEVELAKVEEYLDILEKLKKYTNN